MKNRDFRSSFQMPSVDDLTPLFKAISNQNWAAVEEEAKSVAVRIDSKGQHTAARTLRNALASTNGASRRFSPVVNVNGFGNLPAALKPIDKGVGFDDVCLRSKIRKELDQFVREWQFKDQLAQRGLAPRHRLLLHGPPGCGKSLCASALGGILKLPVYLLRFDSIIGSMLGQTAVNLRAVFEFCEHHPSILLIDEIDALGRHRGGHTDVGELDRIVISLMQELEHNPPSNIVVATCNVPADLDRALWRRFDSHLEFPLPTKAEVTRYAKGQAKRLDVVLSASVKQHFSKRISYADAEKLLEAEARRLVLEEV